MKNKLPDLRNLIFQTIENLVNPEEGKEMDIEAAKTVAQLGSVIVQSAKVEVDYMRVTGNNGSGFITDDIKRIG